MYNRLECQFCGNDTLYVHVSYDRSVSVTCAYSKCEAQWDGNGEIVKMPKGQRRKAVAK